MPLHSLDTCAHQSDEAMELIHVQEGQFAEFLGRSLEQKAAGPPCKLACMISISFIMHALKPRTCMHEHVCNSIVEVRWSERKEKMKMDSKSQR